MRYAIAAILLLFSTAAFSQLDQFRMVGTGSWTTQDDSTHYATVTFASDLTANSFLPTGIVDSMRVFTQRGQVYTIDSVGAKTFSTAVIYVVEYGGDWGKPSGQVVVYETRGRETVPAIPFASNGATSKLQEAVVTHNAAINNGISTATLADSAAAARTYTNNQVAAVAPVKDTIVQALHGFSLGDPIWYSGDYLLALDTGATVRVDGIISEVPDANTFVLQRTGRFTLTSHGFTVGVQLYVQPDGSYSATDTSNTLVYGYALDANTIEIGVKPDAVRATVESRTFEFSRKTLESITRAKNNKKTWVISDTVTISGNIDVSDLDIIFEKNGFISGADTIDANGATLQANSSQQLWSSSTVITGDWNVEKSYLEWTVGNTLTDSIANFRALTNAVEIADVWLKKKVYNVGLSNSGVPHATFKDIRIFGENRDSSELCLLTRTQFSYSGYFNNRTVGNNAHIENLTIRTKDYRDTVQNSFTNNQYPFVFNSYNAGFSPNFTPKVSYITVKNCNIYGDIAVGGPNPNVNVSFSEYEGTPTFNLILEGNKFDQIEAFSSFSAVPWDQAVIKNNVVNNVKGRLFSKTSAAFANDTISAITSKSNEALYFINNTFQSDSIYTNIGNEYLTTIVASGKIGYIQGNKISNLRSTGAVACYPFYANFRKSYIYDNTTYNVLAAGAAKTLLKMKGGDTLYTNNNVFEIDLQGLVDVGILDSTTQDLSSLPASYSFTLIERNQAGDREHIMNITNNEWRTPILSSGTEIQDNKQFKFNNNTVRIGYLGLNSGVSERTIFQNRFSKDVSGQRGFFESTNNIFYIDSTGIDYVGYLSGDYFVTDDLNRDLDYVEIKDKWIADSLTVYYGIPDTKKFIINSEMNGKGSSITIQESQAFSDQAINEGSNVKLKASNYENKLSSISNGLHNLTKGEFSAELNSCEGKFNLFVTSNNELLTQANTTPLELPILYEGEITFDSDELKNNKLNFKYIITEGRALRRLDTLSALVSISAGGAADDTTFLKLNGLNQGIKLAWIRNVGQKPYMQFWGLENFKNIRINVTGISTLTGSSNQEAILSTEQKKYAGTYAEKINIATVINPKGGSSELGAVIDSLAIQYRNFTPIQYNALDTITIDTLNTAFAISPDLNNLDVTNATYTTNANVTTNTTVRLLYYDVSADTYTAFGSGTITSTTNQIQVTGLTQTVTTGDWIYAEVTASGGEANGLSINLRFQ